MDFSAASADTKMRRFIRRFRRQFFRHLAAFAGAPKCIQINGCCGILMYHRVTKRPRGVPAPTWNVTPNKFEEQLSGLIASGFRAIALRDLIEAVRRDESIPHRTFAVTFDDGYENVYVEAWPILKRLRIPATIFLATKYLDSEAPFPFDDWREAGAAHVAKSAWRPLTTEECLAMSVSGLIELGAHTHTHADFRDDPVAFEEDLRACLAVLQSRFAVVEPTFAFPFGKSSAELLRAAKRVGVICALTAEPERVPNHSYRYSWGRFEATQSDTARTLVACLDGRYERMWRWRPDRLIERLAAR